MSSGAAVSAAERAALLQKAVVCYQQANADEAVCRCLEKLGDFASAAVLHERAARWERAGWCFEQAGQWLAAARDYRTARLPLAAARCLVAAGELLEAGWLLAHEGQAGDRARALLAQVTPRTVEEELALALAQARCTAAVERQSAGRVVRQVVEGLGRITAGAGRERVLDWALALTAVLDRPDLIAQLHAVAVETGLPQAAERWEQWAVARLGDASGVDPKG